MREKLVIEAYLECVVEALREYADNPTDVNSHNVKWSLDDYRKAVSKFSKTKCNGGDL